MSRKFRVILWSVLSLLMACVLVVGGYIWYISTRPSYDAGSPALARQWSILLAGFPDVESAQRADERIWGRRFADGRWLIGLSEDSHGRSKDGGTMVLKDSATGVHVYFGHVCGGPSYRWWEENFGRVSSLDEFYRELAKRPLKEHTLPTQ